LEPTLSYINSIRIYAIFIMLELDPEEFYLSFGRRRSKKGLRQHVQLTGRVFYLLAVSYGRLQEDDDEVTVPLLSASKSRLDEENLTGLLNLCNLSIGGSDPSYAYQILISN
jgi:hypothetical protein